MKCAFCCSIDANEAVCVGIDHDNPTPTPACDECCGHGNEDGLCWPIGEAPPSQSAMQGRDAYVWCWWEGAARTLRIARDNPLGEQKLPCCVCAGPIDLFVVEGEDAAN